MRVLLVGRPDERARVRAKLKEIGVGIAGEFDTLADADAAQIRADGILLTDDRRVNDARAREFEEPLTPREVQVLELLAEGLPNKSIAEQLGISDQTVKFHVASILGKLGASNRTDAVRRALRRGLITI